MNGLGGPVNEGRIDLHENAVRLRQDRRNPGLTGDTGHFPEAFTATDGGDIRVALPDQGGAAENHEKSIVNITFGHNGLALVNFDQRTVVHELAELLP